MGTPPGDGACGCCSRPGRRREHTEEAFGRVVVVDPVLCDVCAGLLDLDPGRPGIQRHESARELALDIVGRADPGDRPPRESLEVAQLRHDRDEARAVARLLADVATDPRRLVPQLPSWVTDHAD